MKKVITMVLCDRPQYTRRVLDTLSRCDGVSDYLLLVRVEPVNDEVIQMAQAIDFAEVQVTINPRRLGNARNTYGAWESGFQIADFIVHLEDDTVPARDCLRYMEHCRDAYRRDHRIFSVAAYHRFPCPPGHEFSIASRARYTCWLVGLWRSRWEWARKDWSRNPRSYAIHLSDRLRQHRLREIYPLLSRSQNIGAHGGVYLKTAAWHRTHHHTDFWAGNRRLKRRTFREVDNPMVSAVMITAAARNQRPAIRHAIAAFQKQTHIHKELLIVNHGRTIVGSSDDVRVREISVRKKRRATESSLQNLALDYAEGDWIVWWPEASWHGPDRIAAQMSLREGNRPVLLQREVRLCRPDRWTMVYDSRGFPNSMLFPRKPGLCFRDHADPNRALRKMFGDAVAVDNDPDWNVLNFAPRPKLSGRKPLVTAVMITGLHESRYALARIAIDCFRAQTWPRKELLIINHGATALAAGEPWLREIRVRKAPDETVGDLRNLALRHARGEFVITWDDDDWHAPRRIEVQMALAEDNGAVVLQNQIRHNLLNGSAFYESVRAGIPGTMLHARDVPFRYPGLVRGSDTEFLSRFEKVIALDNDPSLYIRFFHGRNLWNARHVMREFANPHLRHQLRLGPAHRNLVRRLLAHQSAYRSFPNAATRPRRAKATTHA